MAKKQTRRSISVSRTTYERLKAFCEANNVSMSQFVETRVGDFLGEGSVMVTPIVPAAPRPAPTPSAPRLPLPAPIKSESRPVQAAPVAPQQVPMTSAAARFAVEPPPPVIKQKQEQPAPKPAEKRPDQIFTF
ncbi:MAG: hypothetical protein ABI467_19340 [Kofleriaceae bacterium]